MDLHKIKEFIEFTGYMNFTAASKAMHMSQPSLSKHIRDLEKEMDVALIVRGGAGDENSLTPAGQVFLERSQTLLKDFNEMIAECERVERRAPRARIHSLFFAVNISGQIQAALKRQGVENGLEFFTFKEIDNNIRDSLDQDALDFAVHYEPSSEMKEFATEEDRRAYGWIPLDLEPLCMFMRADHPLACKDKVTLDDIKPYEIVNEQSASYQSWYSTLKRVFHDGGLDITIKLLVEDPRKGCGLPLGQEDLCLCTDRCARYFNNLGADESVVKKIAGFEPLVYPFLVYRRDNTNPFVMRIISCMSEKSSLSS